MNGMDKFFKWFSLVTTIVAPVFMVLLAYSGQWLDVITWFFIGTAGFFNYRSAEIIENMEGIENDDRS